MNCPFCNKEMRVVYLVTGQGLCYTEDPEERHIVRQSAQLSSWWKGTHIKSFHCPDCNWFMFQHPKRK